MGQSALAQHRSVKTQMLLNTCPTFMTNIVLSLQTSLPSPSPNNIVCVCNSHYIDCLISIQNDIMEGMYINNITMKSLCFRMKITQNMSEYLIRILGRFADKTSMHGVSYIQKAKLWQAKLIWTLLLILALSILTFHLYSLVYSFTQWPKITTVALGYSNLDFPAVTICNVNRIRKSLRTTLPGKLQNFLAEVDPSLNSNISSGNQSHVSVVNIQRYIPNYLSGCITLSDVMYSFQIYLNVYNVRCLLYAVSLNLHT